MAIGSRVRRKNLVIILLSMTFTLGILAVTMLFSSRAENMELQDMAGMIRGAVEQVNGMYPLTGLYTAGITGGKSGRRWPDLRPYPWGFSSCSSHWCSGSMYR